MEKSSQSLVEEFYKSIKDEVPELSLEDVKEIVQAPWKLLGNTIAKGEMESVRIKHIGVFQVHKKTIPLTLKKNEKNYKNGKLSKEDYEDYKKVLGNT